MTVENSFQTEFRNNVELELQQYNAAKTLEQAVVWEAEGGGAEKVKLKDIVGAKRAKEATERHGRTIWDDPALDGVWLVKPDELYEALLIDDADQLATQISLGGAATMTTAATLDRARVQRIMEGFYAPIISGKTGTTTTPFPAGQIIPVTAGGAAGAQPMNTKKLRMANVMLGAGFAAGGKKWMVLTASDNDALLDEVPATSADFQKAFGAQVDENGHLSRMLGWNFLHIELDDPNLGTVPPLATDANGYRKTPYWVEGGLHGKYWRRLRSEVGKVPELRFSQGTLGGTTLATTRTQAARAGIILNLKV